MIANVEPEIAHTPAASPSIPSRKLTMFITATIQRTVSGIADPGRHVEHADEREREVVDPDAEPDGIAAAATCPASFSTSAARGSRRPHRRRVATAAPSRMPRISPERSRKASDGTKIPRKSARPPSRGTAAG